MPCVLFRRRAAIGFLVAMALPFAPAVQAQGADCLGKDAAVALPACDRALADPDLLTPSKIAQLKRARAVLLIEAGRFQEALDDLAAIADTDGSTEAFHLLRARALAGQARPSEALAAISDGLKIAPLHVPSLLFRAEISLTLNDPESAVADAGLAATLEPENPAANRVMAAALRAVGASESAARSDEAANNPPAAPQPAADPPEPSAPAGQPSDIELTFWNDVKNSGSAEELEAFLATFPSGVFAPLARLRLRKLTGPAPQTAAQVPAPARAFAAFDVTIGDSGDNMGISLIELPGGGYMATGAIGNQADGEMDAWAAGLDRSGNILWQKSWGGRNRDIVTASALLSDGNVLLAQVSDDADDRVDVTARLVAPNGRVLWVRELGKSSRYMSFADVAPLVAGGAVIATASNAANEEDLNSRVVRLDRDGRVIWDLELPVSDPVPDVAVSAVDTGTGIVVLSTVNPEAMENFGMRLMKLDYDGRILWSQTDDLTGSVTMTDLALLPGGDLVVAGSNQTWPDNDVILRRLTPDGRQVWEQALDYGGDEETFAITVTTTGEIAVASSAGVDEDWSLKYGILTWLDDQGRILAKRPLGDRTIESLYGLSALSGGALGLAGSVQDDMYAGTQIRLTALPSLSDTADAALSARNSPLVRKCAALAAHGADTQNIVAGTGLNWEDLDGETAKLPCLAASRLFPDNPTTAYNLGRVFHKLQDYGNAAVYYRKAAEQGYIRALAGLGVVYSEGPDDLRDLRKAVTYSSRAAELGDAIATGALAAMYMAGRGVERDYAKSVALYRMAAEAGLSSAQYELARHYANGWGVPADPAIAASWYDAAGQQGHPQALLELGLAYQSGNGVGRNLDRAMELVEKAANLGSAAAMLEMGLIHDVGPDSRRDYRKAALWYTRAADLGVAKAQAYLGFLYQYGDGVEQDKVRALQLYRQAAEGGDRSGRYWLGRMYETGQVVSRDPAMAATYYELAVEQGSGAAMTALGQLYRDGDGVEKDDRRAYALLKQAADMSFTLAQRDVGWMMYSGRGTPEDVDGAIRYIGLAHQDGNSRASVMLGFIYEFDDSVYDPALAARYFMTGLERGEDYPFTRDRQGWDRRTAREMQRLLREAGYYDGAIDGVVGQGTIRAMKALCDCD